MSVRKVRDIMVPLDKYPVVDSSATVLEAVIRWDDARQNADTGRQPYQAVLVTDQDGKIIGKLGQYALLKALELRGQFVDDRDTLERAGVSDAVMETAFGHLRSLQHELSTMCLGATSLPVTSAMHPVEEQIDVDASLCDAIHDLVKRQTLSLLVTEDDQPVGLIRLSDVCDEVMQEMRRNAASEESED
ncbi:CBS domain-containing protein [candidate division GN15 bacterium]|nr:CBS domain-containing protein [candidate division GN15 bacterium]